MGWLLSIVLWVFASPVLAEPVVIFDAGNTLPLAPYLEAVTVKRSSSAGMEPKRSAIRLPKGRFDNTMLLPIRTPEMTPGLLAQPSPTPTLRERLSPLTRPVFMIGADPHSLDWLAQHREHLKTLGAVGMLVQVDSADELTAVEHAGTDLVIVPASGSLLAQLLGLRHYPVLISRGGIEQ